MFNLLSPLLTWELKTLEGVHGLWQDGTSVRRPVSRSQAEAGGVGVEEPQAGGSNLPGFLEWLGRSRAPSPGQQGGLQHFSGPTLTHLALTHLF